MSAIHFLNVLEGDCNIIQHNTGRVTVIDVSNAYNNYDTTEERKVRYSATRETMRKRTHVPTGKTDYKQKEVPDNPILYLKERLNVTSIMRFILTHPDMDHMDGIKDLFSEFTVHNFWDTANTQEKDLSGSSYGYNKEDWEFYKELRGGKHAKRLTLYAGGQGNFWTEDNIQILCPTKELVEQANNGGDMHDLSYVLLYTPLKKGGGHWKILFAGDSHDNSWNYILDNHREKVTNIDLLFAPHHGRDSGRDYTFLKTLNPKVTLFGNASTKHLAYNNYPKTRITNNQGGHIIIDINDDGIAFYVKNNEFANDFRTKRNWSSSHFNESKNAYFICQINA